MHMTEHIKEIKAFLNNCKVYIFGAGTCGKECLHNIDAIDVVVEGFFDNNEAIVGTSVDSHVVYKPEYVKDAKVVIAVQAYYHNIKCQLLEMGYQEKDILSHIILQYINISKLDEEQIFEYPTTIQFPITYKCNFDCVMCGMRELQGKTEMTTEQVSSLLQDRLFSKVKHVGINGGEPFLRSDFREYICKITDALGSLETVNIISNGYFTSKIKSDLEYLKPIFEDKRIKLNLSISLDAVGNLEDMHRGSKNAYINALHTLDDINNSMDIYVDYLDIICTITRHNIVNIAEVVALSQRLNIPVEYNLASENYRIANKNKFDDFWVMNDQEARMLALEFFYGLYFETGKEKYFALYLYLKNGKRYSSCPYVNNQWVTVLPDGGIEYCAARSKKLGNGLKTSAYELFQSGLIYLDQIKKYNCNDCIQYTYALNKEGKELLIRENLKNTRLR